MLIIQHTVKKDLQKGKNYIASDAPIYNSTMVLSCCTFPFLPAAPSPCTHFFFTETNNKKKWSASI